MKILSITAGAAGMYCGSCSRDNALAVELLSRGHQVTLLPLYTPTNPDERNVSRKRVLFGGISIYLQQYASFFRRAPRFLDRLWDAPWVINAFASRSLSTDPRMLGDLTVSMLEGDRGVLRREFDKLLGWLADEPVPDVVNLPNSLLIGLAAPLHQALDRPICCTLQGEDLFLEGLIEPFRSRAIELIQQQVRDVDMFIAVSDFYVPTMAEMLAIPRDRIAVVPLGINLAGYSRREAGNDAFRVGYFARVAPEKGLRALADAYVHLRERTVGAPIRLEAAGYLAPAQQDYLQEVQHTLERGGVAHEFRYHGAVDRAGKLAFLQSLDVLSVPATYDEPKGVFLLEAMAAGVPVVQPRRGAFTEIVERTGGGVLVAPDDPVALADALHALWKDRALTERLGRQGFAGVREHYSVQTSTDRLLSVYETLRVPAC
ncbi:MAG TPA: glycosyltransferase family 4 protein [Vicinamibacterales bacterium]|nr:glycosyltransferase family 4 protein [Vicinamibacterales bacterium]